MALFKRGRIFFSGVKGRQQITAACAFPVRQVLVYCVLSISLSQAQEAVRMSLASQTAAMARQQAALNADRFDLRLGPTRWKAISALDLEANDNIQFTDTSRLFDLVERPRVELRMLCNASDKNTVELSFASGYSFYTRFHQFDRFFVAPGSGLSFNVYLGDFWLNFHERASVLQDAFADPTLAGSANYAQLQNAAGLTLNADLNRLLLSLGYDYGSYVKISGSGGAPNGASQNLFLSAAYTLEPWIKLGLESGASWIDYQANAVPDALDWNVGSFAQVQPMENLSFQLGAGYTLYEPHAAQGEVDMGPVPAAYARASLNHRLNRFVDYSLRFSRSIDFGFYAGTVDLYVAAVDAHWHLFRKLSVLTGFEFEHGSQVVLGKESFDRFGPHLLLERPITAKASASLRYQAYQRHSSLPSASYFVNVLTLSISYRL